MLKSRFAAVAVLALSAALMLSACGDKTISKSTVEKQIKAKFGNGTAKITDVSCPDDLEAKVGKKETCTITADGKTYKTTATITKVSGDTGFFNLSAPVAA